MGGLCEEGSVASRAEGELIFFFWILGEVSENKTLKRGEENELGEEKQRGRWSRGRS